MKSKRDRRRRANALEKDSSSSLNESSTSQNGKEGASGNDNDDSAREASLQLARIESAMEAGGVGGGGNGSINNKKKRIAWEMLSEPERRWRVIENLNYPFDLLNAAFFVYIGFIHFSDDDVMDPLAWQLAFGSAAIITLMKVRDVTLERRIETRK